MLTYMRDIFRVLSMPCKEHPALFSREIDSALTPGLAMGLRLHVLYCKGCRRYRAQIRRLREVALSLRDELDAGEGMPQDVRERVCRTCGERHAKKN